MTCSKQENIALKASTTYN